jgi:hypothetical protein
LIEPHPKVREDVEKEYLPKIARLQSALEAKTIWANRLHENINAVTVENKDLRMVRSPMQSGAWTDNTEVSRCRIKDRPNH